MPLNVPEQQVQPLKWLLELPDDKLEALLSVLSKAEPQFSVYELGDKVSKSLGVPQETIVAALRVLGSLYLTRGLMQPIEAFVDRDVFTALKRANTFSSGKVDEQWTRVRKFFIAALGFERTLGTAAKTGNVLTQHDRIFVDCRVMTDLRPVFHIDISEKPDAAVIIHMLKITQRDNSGTHKDIYFALDHNDIHKMQTVLERALKKEQTIRNMMKESGLVILNPGPFF